MTKPTYSLDGRTYAKGMLLAVLFSCGCTSIGEQSVAFDNTCSALAEFANATNDYSVHTVALTNDWGGRFCKPGKDNEFVLACKSCSHEDYIPGMRLCDFLLENTSTEFTDVNLKHVLICLDPKYAYLGSPNSKAGNLADTPIWSDRAKSVRPHIAVGVRHINSTDDAPDELQIMVQRRKS